MSSATVGVVIGLCLALPILIIATGNLIVGLMATLTIVVITVSVIGVIPMAGWKLGVSFLSAKYTYQKSFSNLLKVAMAILFIALQLLGGEKTLY